MCILQLVAERLVLVVVNSITKTLSHSHRDWSVTAWQPQITRENMLSPDTLVDGCRKLLTITRWNWGQGSTGCCNNNNNKNPCDRFVPAACSFHEICQLVCKHLQTALQRVVKLRSAIITVVLFEKHWLSWIVVKHNFYFEGKGFKLSFKFYYHFDSS